MRPGERGSSKGMDDVILDIEREIPRLRRYARYLARDVDFADDLVQECLARAVANIDRWQRGTNLRAWLFVILRNVYINEVRSSSKNRNTTWLDPNHPGLAIPGAQEARVELVEVHEAFERLADEQREILMLVVVEQLRYEEAATVLDIPIGTVRSRLARARVALRDTLEVGPHKSVKAR